MLYDGIVSDFLRLRNLIGLFFSTPRGVSIFNNVRKSNLKPILSNFNCTGKVVLSRSHPNTATVHLGVCSFTKDIPVDCTTTERQAAILCIDPIPLRTTTTPEPNYMTIAPVDCKFMDILVL